MDNQSIQPQSEEQMIQMQQMSNSLEQMDIEEDQFGDQQNRIIQQQSSIKNENNNNPEIILMNNILQKAIKLYENNKIRKNEDGINKKQKLSIKLQRQENKLSANQKRKKIAYFEDFYIKLIQKDEYLKTLQKYSKKVKRNSKKKEVQIDTIQNQIYKKELKIQFLETYKLFINEQNDTANIQQAWRLIRQYYFTLLEKSKIFFLVFRFPNASVQKKYRYFLIRNLFKQTFQLLKKSKKKYQTLEDLFQGKQEMYHLFFIFAARQSFVYYDQRLKNDLKELVKIIKDSWYIRMILCQFLKGRQRKLNQIRKIKFQQVITEDDVKEKLKQVKIYYVDYPDQLQGGQTDTSDPLGQFPIYINSFSDYKNLGYDNDTLLIYFFCTILHQIQHSIVRKIGLVKPEQNSHPKHEQSIIDKNKFKQKEKNDEQRSQMEDGGILLQYFAFGGRMDHFREYDYRLIKKLLEFKQNPLPDSNYSVWDYEGNFKLCQDLGILNSQNKQQNQDVQKEKDQDQDQIIQNTDKTLIEEINSKIKTQINEIKQKIHIIQQNFLKDEISKKIKKSPPENETEFEKEITKQIFHVFSQMAKDKFRSSDTYKTKKYNNFVKNIRRLKQKQIQQSEKSQQQNNNLAQIKQMIKYFQKMGCENNGKNEYPKRTNQILFKKRAHSIQSYYQYLNNSTRIQRRKPCFIRRK